MAILITSAAFEDGGVIPDKYSCFGANIQPDFGFSNPPKRTVSYALILHDIDVALDGRTEDGSHWVVWNIPVSAGGVREGSLPPRYYVPRDEVRAELSNTEEVGTSPWKGQWRHLDVTAGGKRIARGAWVYEDVKDVTKPIQGFVSFYPDKVDRVVGDAVSAS